MKRIFRFPVLAGGMVMAAVLASLAPTTSSRVYGQGMVYYNPYGQGPYGGYGEGYVVSANGNMFRSDGGIGPFVRGYGNGIRPIGPIVRGYGGPSYYQPSYGPIVRGYGGPSYYQPSYGPVYVPFRYQGY